MTLYWIYDLSNLVLALFMVVVFVGIAVVGLFVSRPIVGRLLQRSGTHNNIVNFSFAAIVRFYSLSLGLIAVGNWQAYSKVGCMVTHEAAMLDSLYRELKGYPQPVRGDLEERLRTYTRQVIDLEWPAHRRGQVIEVGTRTLEGFENAVLDFNPCSEREKIIHAQVFHSLDSLLSQRRLRLQEVMAGLPALLWVVVLLGGLLTLLLANLFWVENVALHAVLTGLQAIILALLIFLTAAMDNPFRGEFSISSDAFEKVFDQMMKPYVSRELPPPSVGSHPIGWNLGVSVREETIR